MQANNITTIKSFVEYFSETSNNLPSESINSPIHLNNADVIDVLKKNDSIVLFDKIMHDVYPDLYISKINKPNWLIVRKYLELRHYYNDRIAWSVPSKESIDVIIKYHVGNILSVGSGRGLWEAFISKALPNTIIQATDIDPPNETFTSIEKINGIDAILKYNYQTLFINWPLYDNDFAYECVVAFSGPILIFIGEDRGGCTANDKFFDLLHEDNWWKQIVNVNITNWPSVHDSLYVYQRLHN